MKKKNFLKSLPNKMIFIIILLSMTVVFIPSVMLLLQSIAKSTNYPMVIPKTVTMRAFKYVFFNNSSTVEAVLNTVFIGLCLIIINVILAIPAAAAFERYEFKGKLLFKLILFAPVIIPPFTAIMGIYIIFIKLGLTETLIGVIISHIIPTLPYMLKSIMISFSTLDTALEKQAQILGAGSLKRLRYVIFPHILPGIIVGSFLTFLISISQYFLTLLVGGGQVMTLSIVMFPFINGGDKRIGAVYGILFSFIAIINLIIINIFLKKYYRNKNLKII